MTIQSILANIIRKYLKYRLVVYKYRYNSTNTLSKFPLSSQLDNFKSLLISFVKYKIGHHVNRICTMQCAQKIKVVNNIIDIPIKIFIR